MQKHLIIKVSGKVQGVFYRASTKEIADQLALTGFVRNEDDGSVYIEVEGDDAVLQQFVSWCKQGPRMANVNAVDIIEASLTGFKNFEVRR
ncbi:acylphosphatase [Pseudochryseolinea flava]|uniref:acylphosphatase n=1 Tax=Pseudochryseolinea flava TaxID=2059302 RepID=A0A364Y6H8_9BACT|nr:acylphosphatase [Pseudochryseolinea flava]RAW02706.1 acylphosphatase [Pseudochryseolinea flava]